MELNGKTAIITAASGSVGSEVTIALAAAGCRCICQYNRNSQRAGQVIDAIKKSGSDGWAVQADFAEEEQIEAFFAEARRIAAADILINAVGIFEKTPISETNAENLRRMMDINFTSAVLASKEFLKTVQTDSPRPVAKIINITDIGAIAPWAGYIGYCCSKAALIAATKAMAKELAPAVTVNAIAPGMITWPDGFDQTEKERQLKMIPMGRKGQPQDITSAVLFLLQNDYITGQILNIDGGRCI